MTGAAKLPSWRESLSLPRLEEFSSALRTTFINLGFFAATLLLIPALAGQFTRSAVVIEPIAVPKALIRQGLTPEVVANRLWDGLQAFAQSASAARETIVAIPDSQLIEFSLPDAGFSVDSIFLQIRQFFNIQETRIGGEIVCATPDCAPDGLRLRVRVVRTASDIVDLPPMGTQSEQQYYREAAAGIYAIIDPYVAIAAQAETAPLRAATLARGLIFDKPDDAKWAHNLIGDIERKRGELDAAIRDYEAALALDPGFNIARASLALALGDAGRKDEALAALDEVERRDPRNVSAAYNRAVLALAEGDRGAAVSHLLVAAERAPLEPGHFVAAGSLELQMGNVDAAMQHLDEALAINPGHGAALSVKATAYLNQGKHAEAEAVFRQLLEYEPQSSAAHVSIAQIRLQQQDFAGALESADVALALDTDSVLSRLTHATALMGLRRDADAIAEFEGISGSSSEFPSIQSALGTLYTRAGRKDDALAALQKYLELTPANDPGRAGIETQIAELSAEANGR